MFYNYSQNNSYDYNDCISRGACSISPNLTSLQEVMFIILRQIAFYILKLEKAGVENKEVKAQVIEEIATLDAASEYSEEQILNIFSRQYVNLMQMRRLFLKTCKEKGIPCDDLKNLVKFSPEMGLSAIMNKGEKAFLNKYKKMNSKQKYMSEILFGVIKSMSCNLVQLNEFNKTSETASHEILLALDLFNHTRISLDNITAKIENLVKSDIELLALLNNAQKSAYGDIVETDVSYSTRPHKAILVSGSSFSELHSLLSATKDKDIDVYSNGNLLVAHAFNSFHEFPHFRGHFGNGVENCILDFATFPGAILLTKNEAQNIEYLYRGRLFTTDSIPPKGVVRIENDDFTPLIESALQAKGFAKGQQRNSVKVGFNEDDLDKKLDNIAKKFNNKVYKHLFIIGLSSYSSAQNDYFKKFFALIPKNSFVITFSHTAGCDNILSLNVGNDYALEFEVLKKLFRRIPIDSDRVTFFLTKCDVNSLSNMISLKSKGAKSIFLSECPPTIVNPTVLKAFKSIYNIKHTSTPKADLELVLNKKETDE